MADDDMMNGNGSSSFDPMASWARLSERVENQGKDIVDLRSNMNTGFQGVNANLAALSNELRTNSKTQWPVIWAAAGVCFTVLVTIGTFFYGTLSKGQDRLDVAIIKSSETSQAAIATLAKSTQEALTKISESMVSQKEMEWRSARGAEDRMQQQSMLKDLRDAQVPRQELDRVWTSYDQRFSDHQRQIDEVKQAQGSVYSQRDIILDLKENQQRLEREIARLAAINGGAADR